MKGCEQLGRVQGAALSMIGDVESQRDASARNKAADMKGSRAVRGEVNLFGTRSYDVYRCASRPAPVESDAGHLSHQPLPR